MRFLFRLPSENVISALGNGVCRVSTVFFFAAGTLIVTIRVCISCTGR
jgi:hypothetical protein